MTIPISVYNDKKVRLEEELLEKTVAFRDLAEEERAYLINSHKTFYKLRSNLPLIMVIFILYEAAIIYFGLKYVNSVGFDDSEIFLFLAIVPAVILFESLRREENLYKDIGRPVVKTVGTLKTYEIVRRRHTEKYFTVEGVRFDNKNNDSQVVEEMFSIFGKNQSFSPVRVEYSPFSKMIWQIKKRTIDNKFWEVIYCRLLLPDFIRKQTQLNSSTQNSNQKSSL